MHLLLLSHAYVVPQLKQLCEWHLEHGLLNTENVIDVFQLSLLCDFPRLSVISHRMIMKHFKELYATEAWIAMKKSHPFLEKELRDSVIIEENVSNKLSFPLALLSKSILKFLKLEYADAKRKDQKTKRAEDIFAAIRSNGSSCSYMQRRM